MAIDLIGASLTTREVREISSNIEQIGKDIDETMKSVNNIMKTLTGQSEGGLIENTTIAVQQLEELCKTLCQGIIDIGLAIGEYLRIMLTQDQEAADNLRRSMESRK